MTRRTYVFPDPTGICRPFKVSAVVTSGDYFCLVTVNWTGRSIQLVPSACMMFDIDDSTLAWRGFEHCIDVFCIEMKIPIIVVRRGPHTGPYTASARALKVEAILETIPALAIERVSSASVTGWLNRRPWLLPLPDDERSARERKVQQRCIETASYVVARVLQRRVDLYGDEKGQVPCTGDLPVPPPPEVVLPS